jgi:hypothetical protein
MLFACTDKSEDDGTAELGMEAETSGDGDGDPTGDGDGDGDPTTGDGDGDGDGDPTTGDGDGDPTTGDGDGDGDTGGGAACMGMEAPAGSIAIGQPFSHWGGGFTPEGEEWDYCNLEGTPFILVISGAWCGPCNDLAAGMAGLQSGWGTQLDPIRAALETGQLAFVEVLLDNFIDFDAVALSDLQQWEMMYPNEFVHLIGDPTPGLNGTEPLWIYMSPVHNGAVPEGVLIDANFNVEAMGLQSAVATATANYTGG